MPTFCKEIFRSCALLTLALCTNHRRCSYNSCNFCMAAGQKQVYCLWFPFKKSHLYSLHDLCHGPNFFVLLLDSLLFSFFYAEGWLFWGSQYNHKFFEAVLVLRCSETLLKVIKLITPTYNSQNHPIFSSQSQLVSNSYFTYIISLLVLRVCVYVCQ